MAIKKGLAVLATSAALFAGAAAANAAVGSDVQGTKYQAPIQKLASLGIATGYEDGSIQPDKTITRAEFAAIVVRELHLGDNFAPANTKFSDVNSSHWAGGYINVAVGQGILKGYPDGTFKPEAPVTYAEAATMLVRMLGYGPSCDENNWPASYIGKAASIGVTDGVSVAAGDSAKRGDVFMMAANSLTIDIMKQDSWGTDTIWKEQKDENLLTENFNITIWDDKTHDNNTDHYKEKYLTVDDTSRVDVNNLNSDQIKIGGTKYNVNKMFDPNTFLGQDVLAWVNEDNDYVYYMEPADNQEVMYDSVVGAKSNNDEVWLDDDDDNYKFASSYKSWMNSSKQDFNANTWDDVDVKVVLNENDEVVSIVGTDYYSGYNVNGYVSNVDAQNEVITYGDEEDLDLDGKDYTVIRNGEPAALEDIKAGDVINVMAAEKNDEYTIYATSKTVKGTVEKINTSDYDRISKYDIYIDGVKYDMASDDACTLSEDGNDTIDAIKSDDLKDLNGQDVTLYLDANGDVLHISSGELSGSSDLAGVVDKASRYDSIDDEVVFSLINKDNKEIKFTFDSSDVDYKVDGVKQSNIDTNEEWEQLLKTGTLVEYKLDKNGDLDQVDVITKDAVEKTLNDKDLDEDDNTVSVDGSSYNVTDKTVIWNVSFSDPTDYEKISWDDIKKKDNVKAKVFTDKEDVEYMLVYSVDDKEGSVSANGIYGIVTGFGAQGNDDTINIINAEGQAVEYVCNYNDDAKKGDFVRIELDADDEVDQLDVLSHSNGSIASDINFNDIDLAKTVTVDKKTSSYIEGKDGKYYNVNSNTVYFDTHDTDELDTVSTVSKNDRVLMIDTDDDGSTYDYVVIVQEDYVDSADQQTVDNVKDSLSLAATATSDFNLTTAKDGAAIEWKSDNNAIKIENGKAVVTRGDADVTVKLTATITKGDASATKEFNVIVKAKAAQEVTATVAPTETGVGVNVTVNADGYDGAVKYVAKNDTAGALNEQTDLGKSFVTFGVKKGDTLKVDLYDAAGKVIASDVAVTVS